MNFCVFSKEKVQEVPQGLCTSTPGKSLVQSVLSAAAQVNEGSHGCDDSIMTLCNQIDDLKQGLLELADIGHGKKASHQALEQIKQLQDDRYKPKRFFSKSKRKLFSSHC